VTVPAEGIGRGVAAVLAAVIAGAERDADDRAASLGRHIMRLQTLRRLALRRTRRRKERGMDGPARIAYDPPGIRIGVRLSARDLSVLIAEARRQRAEWLERAA